MAASGNGPVNALDNAMRRALERFYSVLAEMRLVDYKVRVITSRLRGTASLVRVLITSSDGQSQRGTVGLSANIVEASWRALVDSIEYKLSRDRVLPIRDDQETEPEGSADRRMKEAIR